MNSFQGISWRFVKSGGWGGGDFGGRGGKLGVSGEGGTSTEVKRLREFFILFHEISFTMMWKHEQGYIK